MPNTTMNRTLNIAVASQNPAKINAVKLAYERVFPDNDTTVTGYSVPSGVPDQPRTIEETQRGAENRVTTMQASVQDADYWAGIEGGIEDENGTMYAYACIVISNGKQTGLSMTGKFVLPNAVAEIVRDGEELGIADDIVFSRRNSKRTNGAVGLLTSNVITRTSLYEHAVILALIPFITPDLYPVTNT